MFFKKSLFFFLAFIFFGGFFVETAFASSCTLTGPSMRVGNCEKTKTTPSGKFCDTLSAECETATEMCCVDSCNTDKKCESWYGETAANCQDCRSAGNPCPTTLPECRASDLGGNKCIAQACTAGGSAGNYCCATTGGNPTCNNNGRCDAGEPAGCDGCPGGGNPTCNNNGQCEAGETPANCQGDCGTTPGTCGNGRCDSGETAASCPSDCGSGGGGGGGNTNCNTNANGNTKIGPTQVSIGANLSCWTISGVIMRLLQWLLYILGFLSVLAFVIAGIMYLTSAGNDEMIEKAKTYTIWSIVGIIVALSGLIIITAIDALLKGNNRV